MILRNNRIFWLLPNPFRDCYRDLCISARQITIVIVVRAITGDSEPQVRGIPAQFLLRMEYIKISEIHSAADRKNVIHFGIISPLGNTCNKVDVVLELAVTTALVCLFSSIARQSMCHSHRPKLFF